ncbi:MAG: hypothetical protein ACP5N7_01845 [Candidatus Pacearchaeota archaeon]
MKKEAISILLMALLLLTIVSAAEIEGQIKENTEKLESVSDNIRKINDKDLRNEFLQEEGWIYFFNKTSAGKIVVSANEGLKQLNPFWNLVLGVNYNFSWGFWIAFAIWFTLFFLLLPPSEILLKNKIYAILVSFAIASLIGLSGIIREATNIAGTIVTNWVAGVMALLLAFLIVFLSKKSNKFWKQLKEKEEKRKEEQSRQVLYIDAETIKKKIKKSSFDDKTPYIGR